MTTDLPTEFYAPCVMCGAKCLHKTDASGWRVIWRCNGDDDDKACGGKGSYGRGRSRALREKAAGAGVTEKSKEGKTDVKAEGDTGPNSDGGDKRTDVPARGSKFNLLRK